MELTPNPILEPVKAAKAAFGFTDRSTRKKKERKIERYRQAAGALGEITHGLDRYMISKGQFSLIDLIRAVLDQIGPADFAISTWTATGADISEAFEFLHDGRILSARWLLDFTFQRRQPAFAGQLRELFGDESIRITRNHAKIVLLTNDEWNVTILSSMNLNLNPRMEFVLVREDRDLAAFNLEWIGEIFETKPPATDGEWTKKRSVQKKEFAAE